MAKVGRILALLALVVMLSALPLTAFAQQDPPHVLIGTATLNGAIPPVDTEVTAMEGSARLGSAITMPGGQFSLQIMRPPSGGAITFMVAGVDASERLTHYEIGKIQSGFILTAMASTFTPREPPHVLIGTATLYGEIPPVGTEIVATAGGAIVGSTLTRAGGKFALLVSRPIGGDVVSFTVAGVNASERLANWEFGKIQPGFNLTTRNIAVADGLEPLIASDNLVSVWHFDNITKSWQFYAPLMDDDNTLTTLRANQVYLIHVMRSADVSLNGTTRSLTCSSVNCWNQIVW